MVADVADVKSKFDRAVRIVSDASQTAESAEEAIELLTDVLESRTSEHGEVHLACAPAFYYYGLALFQKARLENDVFGAPVQQAMVEKAVAQLKAGEAENEAGEGAGTATAPAAEGKGKATAAAPAEDEGEDAASDSEEEEDYENDMELAWRNLETARLIYEKEGGHVRQLADCFGALAELSMEREDFETSIGDFKSAIGVLQPGEGKGPAPEGCERVLAEYQYKLCLALQLFASNHLHSAPASTLGSADAGPAAPAPPASREAALAALRESLSCCQKARAILAEELSKARAAGSEGASDLEGILEELELKAGELEEGLAAQAGSGAGTQAAPRQTSQLGFDKPMLAGGPKREVTVVSGKGGGGGRVSLRPVPTGAGEEAQPQKKQRTEVAEEGAAAQQA